MHPLLKAWLDYKEYVYYYNTVLVVVVASLFDVNPIIKLLIEFAGVKYFVFNNKWNVVKNLGRELFLFVMLALVLIILNMFLPKWGHWNIINERLDIKKKVKNILTANDTRVKKYFAGPGLLAENIFKIGYKFLTLSVVSYPVYRYVIFTPV